MKTNILLMILLAFAVSLLSVQKYKGMPGIDFYKFWGVSKAKKVNGFHLKSPYVEESQYAAALDSYAETSNDSRLKKVNEIFKNIFQDNLSFTGTPLCYWLFGIMPKKYSLAFAIFQAMQIILFMASVVILYSRSHEPWPVIILLALVLAGFYQPFLSDLRVGNISSLQLFGLAALIVFAERALPGPYTLKVLSANAIFMCSLVLLTLIKPILAFVTLLLSIHLWALHGTKVFSKAIIPAVIFGVLLLLIPSLYFESLNVWLDWYNYVINEIRLYPVSEGNIATVSLVSQISNISVYSTTAVLAALLLFLGLGALLMFAGPGESGLKGLWGRVLRLCRDPFLCAAAGVTLTLALFPLVWLHYFVLSLIPAIWLFIVSPRCNYISLLGGLSIILTSGLPAHLFIQLFGTTELLYSYSVAFGWVPLWAGLLAMIAVESKVYEA